MMDEECLSPEEFEKLFSMSDGDYAKSAPQWLAFLPRQAQVDHESVNVNDLLQQLKKVTKTTKRLEQVLTSSGLPVPMDIPYLEAKEKVAEINARLQQDCADNQEYKKLCSDLEKYTAALMASDEYQLEIQKKEQAWENEIQADNREALNKLRRHIPINIRSLSEAQLVDAYGIPKPMARKFKRTNILELIRKSPADMERMHPSILEGLKTTGLTLTERRALYEHMKTLGAKWGKAKDQMSERKLMWFNMLKSKLMESIQEYKRHVEEYGPPSSTHKCKAIGNQCPFKADAAVDYSGDYGCNIVGFDYEDSDAPVQQAKAPDRSKSSEDMGPPHSSPVAAAAAAAKVPQRSKSSFGRVGGQGSENNKDETTPRPTAPLSFLGELSAAKLKKATPTPPPPKSPGIGKKTLLAEIQGKKPQTLSGGPPKNLLSSISSATLKKNICAKPVAPNTPKRKLLKEICPAELERLKEAPYLPEIASPATPKKKEVQKAAIVEKVPDKTPEEKRTERDANLEKHYKGDKKAIKDAQRHCDMLENGLDLLDSAMNDWVELMVTKQDAKLDDEQKQEQMESFAELSNDMEPLAVALEERAKWVSRSWIECCLSRDLYRSTAIAFNFIRKRMTDLDLVDKASKKKRKEVSESLHVVHTKNLKEFEELGIEPAPTRTIPNVAQLIKKKLNPEKEQEESTKQKVVKRVAVRKVKKIPEVPIVEAKKEPEPEPEPVQISVEEMAGRDQLKWQLIRQLKETRKMQHKLEKAITNAGLTIPDEKISYDEAKEKMAEISKRMQQVSFKDPEYYTLEQEMEKYQSALMSSDEHRQAIQRNEQEWETENAKGNLAALKKIRRHMPVQIRNMSEADLTTKPTPNGRKLPLAMAKKFKRTAALQLIRRDPSDIEKMHFANLEGMSLSGLTLTESCALYEHIRSLGTAWEKAKSDKSIERKYMWYMSVRNKVKSGLEKYQKHVADYGDADRHRCNFSASQCPVQSDAAMDYSGDYGYPEDAFYESVEVVREDLENLTEKAQEDARRAIEERTQFWNDRS